MHKTEKYGILIGNVKQSLWPHYDPVHPLHIPHQEPSCPTHQTQKKEEERNDHRLSLANGHVYVRAIKPFSFTPELQGLSEAFCMSFRFVSNPRKKTSRHRTRNRLMSHVYYCHSLKGAPRQGTRVRCLYVRLQTFGHT